MGYWPERDAELLRLRSAGMSGTQIAKVMRMRRQTVYDRLRIIVRDEPPLAPSPEVIAHQVPRSTLPPLPSLTVPMVIIPQGGRARAKRGM